MKLCLPIRKIASVVAFSLTSLTLSAQAPTIQWDKTFGGSSLDILTSMIPTPDGGYIIGGSSESGISGDKIQPNKGVLADYWVLKLDASGNKVWDKTIGGFFDDGLHSMVLAPNGYILGGSSNSPVSSDKTQPPVGGFDNWIVLVDAAGNKMWDRTIGGSGNDVLNRISQTSNGGYIIGGTSDSGLSGDKTQPSNGSNDYWIIRLDPNGNKLWDKAFGGSGSDGLSYIAQTTDGGYILGGSSDSGITGDKTQPSKGDYDYWMIKLDGNGNKLWDKTFGGSSGDLMTSLTQTPDGGYLLGGYSTSGISGDKTQASKGGSDFWVIKTDAAGNKQWDKTIGGSASENLRSLARTSDGGFVVGGSSSSGISGDKTESLKGTSDYWVVKLDGNGNKTWDKSIGGSAANTLISLYQLPGNNYILGGMSDSGISGNKTQANRGGLDYWMVKLNVNPTGMNESASDFNLSVSPNPSQGNFQLQLNNLTAKTAAITISDLVGRTVYQQEILVTGNQIQQEINLPKTKGMYMLQVKAGEQTTTRKIVIE